MSNYNVKKFNLKKLKTRLHKHNLPVTDVEQRWRHVHALIEWQGKTCLFKMAASKEVAKTTRNEVRFNKHYAQKFNTESEYSFTIPNAYKSGYFDSNFYFIQDYYPDKVLYELGLTESERRLNAWIEVMATTLHELPRVKGVPLYHDKNYKRLKNPGKRFFKRSLSYQKTVKRKELDKLLPIAENIVELYRPCIAHGDFVPWHMFPQKNGKLAIIDGEQSCNYMPAFYDLAFCYQRLYTYAKVPKAARKLAKCYREQLGMRKRNFFDKAFRAVLAERVFGAYWDEKQERRRKDYGFHQELLYAVESNDLY